MIMQKSVGYFLLVLLLPFGTLATKQPAFYFQHWCNNELPRSLQYLDDGLCAKMFPLNDDVPNEQIDREWSCQDKQSGEHNITELLSKGYQTDMPLGANTIMDLTSLGPFITSAPPSELQLCLIVTKRVGEQGTKAASTPEAQGAQVGESPPKLLHKYFCYGNSSALDAHETWSSSKIFAVANAAGALRIEEPGRGSPDCGTVDTYGLPSMTSGKHGVTPLGDLATVVCSYDTTAGYSSNSLASYFHDMGWRSRIQNLVSANPAASTWVGSLPGAQGQTLGGNYGEPTPADLHFSLSNDLQSSALCTVELESPVPAFTNTISSLTAAEMVRRIAQHREIPPPMQFPGMQWEDAQALLYGEKHSVLFPGLELGGMSVDPAIFLQSAISEASWANINAKSTGTSTNTVHESESAAKSWRIFSKLGAGWSSSRSVGEIISTAYGCFPSGAGVSDNDDSSFEFALSVRGSVPGDTTLVNVQALVMAGVNGTIQALLQGKLDI